MSESLFSIIEYLLYLILPFIISQITLTCQMLKITLPRTFCRSLAVNVKALFTEILQLRNSTRAMEKMEKEKILMQENTKKLLAQIEQDTAKIKQLEYASPPPYYYIEWDFILYYAFSWAFLNYIFQIQMNLCLESISATNYC